jgi:hypothetical protein
MEPSAWRTGYTLPVPAFNRGSRVGFAGCFGVMLWELLAGEGYSCRLADGRKRLKELTKRT